MSTIVKPVADAVPQTPASETRECSNPPTPVAANEDALSPSPITDHQQPAPAVQAARRRPNRVSPVDPIPTEPAPLPHPTRSVHRPPGSTSKARMTPQASHRSLIWASWDPCRPVDWRWRSALEIAQSDHDILTDLDPPEVAVAVEYLQASTPRGDNRQWECNGARWADLDAACQLAQTDGPQLWETQSRILAGQDDRTIAAHVGLAPATIDVYERMFFSVRNSLDARDWILLQAIGWSPADPSRTPTLAEVWRGVGYNGGERVLDLAIAVTLDQPLPTWTHSLPGAGDPTFEARLRLRCQLAVEVMMLPHDLDAIAIARLHLCELAREAAREPVDSTSTLRTRMDEILAETKLQTGGWTDHDARAAGVA